MALNSTIAIIGVGRLGGALALALTGKGYKICQLISRNQERTQKIADLINPAPEILSFDVLAKISAEIVLITTPDSEIQRVAESLAGKLKHQPVVFHASGALSSKILQNLKSIGCSVGSLHPLVSISDSQTGAARFKDVYFCIEGDTKARSIAEKIVAALEGKSFSVATKYKTLYHASAVMASGHLTAILSAAIESLTACGIYEKEAQKILFPLIASTVENLKGQTPSEALTGTFARADVETLKRHLESLNAYASKEVGILYRLLGLRSLRLAELQGANAEKVAEMRDLLTESEKGKPKNAG